MTKIMIDGVEIAEIDADAAEFLKRAADGRSGEVLSPADWRITYVGPSQVRYVNLSLCFSERVERTESTVAK